MKVKPIPEGYRSITPYLIFRGASKAIEFYQKVFQAKEIFRMNKAEKIGHAEIQIGDSKIMLADEVPEMGTRSPQTIGGSPISIHLYVENADAVFQLAIKSGAKVIRPLERPLHKSFAESFRPIIKNLQQSIYATVS